MLIFDLEIQNGFILDHRSDLAMRVAKPEMDAMMGQMINMAARPGKGAGRRAKRPNRNDTGNEQQGQDRWEKIDDGLRRGNEFVDFVEGIKNIFGWLFG